MRLHEKIDPETENLRTVERVAPISLVEDVRNFSNCILSAHETNVLQAAVAALSLKTLTDRVITLRNVKLINYPRVATALLVNFGDLYIDCISALSKIVRSPRTPEELNLYALINGKPYKGVVAKRKVKVKVKARKKK